MSSPLSPPFAAALRSRHFGQSRADFDTSAPLPSRSDRLTAASMLPGHAGDPDRLQAVVANLEGQLARLRADDARAQEVRADIVFNSQLIGQYEAQVAEQADQLRIVRQRNQRLEDRVAQMRQQLENKRQEANDKEKILEQLQMDITLLSGDLQRLLERTAQHRATATQKDQFDVQPPQRFNEYSEYVPFEGRPADTWPPAPQTDIAPARESYSPPPRPHRAPAALADNISFGEVKPPATITSGRSLPELKAELAELQNEKAKLERLAQKAPAPGVSQTRARRERAELEDRLDDVERKIGSIRLAIRQLGAGSI